MVKTRGMALLIVLILVVSCLGTGCSNVVTPDRKSDEQSEDTKPEENRTDEAVDIKQASGITDNDEKSPALKKDC